MELKPNATRYNKLVNQFHEANELFDRTVNVLNYSVFAADSNECCTYSQAMKQDNCDKFIKAMQVEVEAHEERNHWTMVLQSTLPE